MIKLTNKLRVVISVIALSTLVLAPLSHSSNMVTDAEVALLPEYCKARFGGKNEVAFKNWSQRFGASNFIHMHHFCFGLNFMSRAAMEVNPKKKKFILQQAIRNFDYVLSRWPREFSLTSAAASYRQQAEMMLSFN